VEYRRLGRSGLKVSSISLGTMNFGHPTSRNEAIKIVDIAADSGINLFDCADTYNKGDAEKILGEAFQKNKMRKNVFIASKVFNQMGPGPNDGGNSRHHIIAGCEDSLRRLQTEYIDIYYLHRTDFSVSQEESLEALEHLRRQGKIRYAACSTHPAWRTVEAIHISKKYGYPRFVCEQPPYNLLDRRIENEIIPMCEQYDLGIISWSPLAQGLLAGRVFEDVEFPEGSRGSLTKAFKERITAKGVFVGKKFSDIAKNTNVHPGQLAIAWVLHQKAITSVITGPRNADQLLELLPATEVKLNKNILDACDLLVPPGRYVTSFFNTTDWMKSKGA
jgi:aryl-alcohol dehydrogenase-like predicted oxidoreductase